MCHSQRKDHNLVKKSQIGKSEYPVVVADAGLLCSLERVTLWTMFRDSEFMPVVTITGSCYFFKNSRN